MNKNIAVAGTGYVGMSIATLLAQHNHVTAVDVIPEKVEKINNKISPIQDDYIEQYLAEKELDLTATLDGAAAYKDADYVVIAAPTNYDPQKNFFDTRHVEEVIDLVLKVNPDAVMVIKSTIPVGYTRNLYVQYAAKSVKKFNLLFSPEFLRESKALYDNLYPSRIIVGSPKIIDRPEFEEEFLQVLINGGGGLSPRDHGEEVGFVSKPPHRNAEVRLFRPALQFRQFGVFRQTPTHHNAVHIHSYFTSLYFLVKGRP